MKKYLLFIFFALLFVIQKINARSVPDAVIAVGYCPENYEVTEEHLYIADAGVRTISIAVELVNKDINGDKIYAIRTPVYSPQADVTFFISTDLNKEPVYTQKINDLKDIKNQITIPLDIPYTLTGEKTYVGYTQKIGEECSETNLQRHFPFWKNTSQSRSPKSDLVCINGGEWMHMADYTENKYVGSWCLWAYVSGGDYSEEIKNDLKIAYTEYGHDYFIRKGEPVIPRVPFYNLGAQVVKSVELTYENSQTKEPRTLSYTDVDTYKHGLFWLSLPEQVFTIPGDQSVSVKVIKVNGRKIKESTSTQTFVYYKCMDNFFDRHVLIEEFTSQEAEDAIEMTKAIESCFPKMREKYSWVSHHAGFGEDQFTLRESVEYASFFEVNRYNFRCLPDRSSYTPIPEGAFPGLDPRSFSSFKEFEYEPSLVSVNLSGQYNSALRELSLTVAGEFLEDFPRAKLNVFLTEDGLVAPQKNGGEEYVHNHVLRAVLSDTFGDAIDLADGKYSKSYSYIIPETINGFRCDPRNMKIIAFVANYSTPLNSEIHNTAEIPLNTIGAIQSAISDVIHVYSDKGTVHINGGYEQAAVYTPDGQLVKRIQKPAPFRLEEGLYLIKVVSGKESIVHKIIVTG